MRAAAAREEELEKMRRFKVGLSKSLEKVGKSPPREPPASGCGRRLAITRLGLACPPAAGVGHSPGPSAPHARRPPRRPASHRACPSSALLHAASASAAEAGTEAAAGDLLEINQTNFYDYVGGQGDKLVVVDFYTDWCVGDCRSWPWAGLLPGC